MYIKRKYEAFKRTDIYVYLFIVFFSFLLYGQTCKLDFSMDDGFVLDNLYNIENTGGGIKEVLSQSTGQDYRPVTMLSFWIEKKITGTFNSGTAHLINVALFALLLIQIFRMLTLGFIFKDSRTTFLFSLIVVILFLIHPIHADVVANIKSRDSILSMLLGITSSIQIIFFFNTKKKWRIAVFLFFLIMANLAKADAYVFLLLPLLFYLINVGVKIDINRKNIIPAFLISFLVLFLYLNTKNFLRETIFNVNLSYRTYIDSPLYINDTFLRRLSLSLTTMLYYLKFFFLPFNYLSYYGIDEIRLLPLFSLNNIFSLLMYILVFIFSITKYKQKKIYLFSFLFYLLSIAYASNLPAIVSGVLAPRYNFIGSLGITMFIAAFIVEYVQSSNWKIVKGLYFMAVVLILCFFTFQRTKLWKNRETLFLSDMENGTRSLHTHQMLSSVYMNDALFGVNTKQEADEKMKQAVYYIDKGLKISDFEPFLLENKGISLIYYEQPNKAKYYFRKALQLDSTQYTNINHLGLCFRNENNLDSALYYFGVAMNKQNLFEYAANNYIETLIKQKRYSSVDSTVSILQRRFPNDDYFNKKVNDLKVKGVWYNF